MFDSVVNLFRRVVEGINSISRLASDSLRRSQFNAAKRIEFYRAMTLFQSGGLSTPRAFQNIREAWASRGLVHEMREALPPEFGKFIPVRQQIIAKVARDGLAAINAGESLSSSLANWISPTERALLSVGEESGDMVGSYRRIIDLIKKGRSLKTVVLAALAYPTFVLLMLVSALYGFSSQLLPELTPLVKPAYLGDVGKALMFVAPLVEQYAVLFVVLIVLASTTVLLTFGTWCGRIRQVCDSFQPWSIYRSINGAVFLSTFAILQRSGMRIEDAFDILKATATPWLRERIVATNYGIRQGQNLGRALINAGHSFPDKHILPAIEAFSGQPDYAKALDEFAQEWLEQTIERTTKQAKLLFVFSMLVSAFVISFMGFGFSQIQSAIV